MLVTPVCGGMRVPRLEYREERGRAARRHVALWRPLEQLRGARTARQMRRLRHRLVPQEVRAPAPRLVQFLPLPQRHPVRVGDVGLEPLAIRDQHGHELRTNLVGGRLDRVQPREIAAVEELDRGDLREIHEGRLRGIAAAPAGQQLDAALDAPVRPRRRAARECRRAAPRSHRPAPHRPRHRGARVLDHRRHARRRTPSPGGKVASALR